MSHSHTHTHRSVKCVTKSPVTSHTVTSTHDEDEDDDDDDESENEHSVRKTAPSRVLLLIIISLFFQCLFVFVYRVRKSFLSSSSFWVPIFWLLLPGRESRNEWGESQKNLCKERTIVCVPCTCVSVLFFESDSMRAVHPLVVFFVFSSFVSFIASQHLLAYLLSVTTDITSTIDPNKQRKKGKELLLSTLLPGRQSSAK